MYHLISKETKGVLDLVSDPFWFGIRKVNFVKDWDHWKVLVVSKEEICHLKVSDEIQRMHRLSLDSLGSVDY